MRYCDLCGTRIPDGFIEAAARKKPVEAAKPARPIEPTSTSAKAPQTELAEPEREVTPLAPREERRLESEKIPSAPAVVFASVAATRPTQAAPVTTEAKTQAERTRAPRQVKPTAPVWGRTRLLGASLVGFGVLTVVASVLVGAVELGGLGLASFLIGLLLIYLPSQPALPPQLVEASLVSSLANLERMLREFSPETKALYLNVRDRLDVPMVLLPMSDNPNPSTEVDLKDEDRLLLADSEDPHRSGLLLEAPGASLLTFMEKESGVEFFDLGREDLVDALRSGMVESLEAVADLKGAMTDSGVTFRMKDGPLAGLSRDLAKSAPKTIAKLGCPLCSALVCAAVKTLKRELILEEATHHQVYHNVTLRFASGATHEAS